ncbi:uncharacterized protein LOC131227566 isoform X2 [Magnolia sinica]|nr:uncharacterized protein LOC131227566 isoform X2 [Magnolia sinica]XP_058079351.1 uncharacterized protein LOC131227566 isoform X2 [Magnolia sinica]XP_058079352.1 uncharacterized protein LOC131227566 isoform X2 [Magnolia sinica]XP_058079353.1 uncharacterized protein LOC131227566 isoform X2 [Magnolia sinica]
MELLEGSLSTCPRNQHCAHWARVYMKYCLCSVKDGASLALGLVSVISWGVAEIPQIITNFREKSTEGLSIAFLMTWIIGDLFNLIGCKLEPATLPTQYYMAFLYTVTTVILASQTVYYGHIYHRLKANRLGLPHKVPKLHDEEAVSKNKQNDGVFVEKGRKSDVNQTNGSSVAEEGLHKPSSPISVSATVNSHHGSHERDLYYMSARSLTKSHTPTVGSYLARSRDYVKSPSTNMVDQNSIEEPLLRGPMNMQSSPPPNTKSMLCVVTAAMFFLSSFDLDLSRSNRFISVLEKPHRGIVIQVGRKLLQSNGGPLLQDGAGGSGIGTILGWAMAAIYMGGRLPQICLNIRRGSAEGLNPFMFIFALIGNLTYVASILVNSLEWSKIRSNLPWLVDAGGCVILDTFILVQFIYFRWRKSKGSQVNHDLLVAA